MGLVKTGAEDRPVDPPKIRSARVVEEGGEETWKDGLFEWKELCEWEDESERGWERKRMRAKENDAGNSARSRMRKSDGMNGRDTHLKDP